MGWWHDRRLVAMVAVAYVAGLVVLVVKPWGWTLNRLTVHLYVFFRTDWPVAPRWALPEHYGVLLNVLLFLPLGAMLAALTGRWRWTTLVCLAGSVLIELAQWRWFEREGTWSDVVANTLGALVGAVAVTLWIRARSAPGSRSA